MVYSKKMFSKEDQLNFFLNECYFFEKYPNFWIRYNSFVFHQNAHTIPKITNLTKHLKKTVVFMFCRDLYKKSLKCKKIT